MTNWWKVEPTESFLANVCREVWWHCFYIKYECHTLIIYLTA